MIAVSTSTSASELQHLIDSAPAGEDIVLEPGTFVFDRTICIDRNDISLTGAGAGATVIVTTGLAFDEGAFRVGSGMDLPAYTGRFTLAAAAAQEAKQLTLSDASGLKTGDILWIERPNTAEYLDAIGDALWREDKPLRTSMLEVEAVSGNTVLLRNGLAFDFDAADAVVRRLDVVTNLVLGGFTIQSGLGEPDAASFENVNAAWHRDNAVLVSSVARSQVFDIEILNTPSNGFTFTRALGVQAEGLRVEGAHNKGDGGNGYGVQLRAVYDSSFTGLEAVDTRNAVVFASWTSEANNRVEVDFTNRDINFHGGPDHGNVVEVESSVRSELEARYLSPTLFINSEGTSYGAPTVAGANSVTFGHVWATNKGEVITAGPNGAEVHARSGSDTLIGAGGRDRLYADSGEDKVIGSAGNDWIDGGYGADRMVYSGRLLDFGFTMDSQGRIIVHKPDGFDVVSGVESFVFADRILALSELPVAGVTHFGVDGAARLEVVGTDAAAVKDGLVRADCDLIFTLPLDTAAAPAAPFTGDTIV